MRKTLILYYSATGTTKQAAQELGKKLGADLAEIHPVQPYSANDLNWHDESTRATVEQHEHQSRVAIKDDLPDLANYDTVILGHPVWWGIPPRMIASVIDQLDLNGKTLASFGTSSSTPYDRSQAFIDRTVAENGYQLTRIPGTILNRPGAVDRWIATNHLN